MSLFEVAAIFESDEDGVDPEIVLEPQTLLAETQQSAFMKALQNNPSAFEDYNLDNVEVLVRPFA